MRLIALERGLHCVIFGLLSIGLVLAEIGLPWLRDQVRTVVEQTSRAASQDWVVEQLERLADVQRGTLTVLLVTSLAYFVVEGVEAVGLWKERRWAEYLTVLATVGFLPFELHALVEEITVVRVGALVVNLVVLAYLLWAKRLFGLRGGTPALRRAQDESVDWDRLLAEAPFVDHQAISTPSPSAQSP